MSYKYKIGFIAKLLGLLLACGSCLNRQFIDGYAEIVSISDSTLSDSSLFFGYTRQVDYSGLYPIRPYEIWIENTAIKVYTDSSGYFSIKTMPGTYALKCQYKSNNYEQLIEELKNIEIKKNQKIEVGFYIGYTIE
ncbi:MAG: hypothetical protein QNK30_15090 [Bacteroidales bacterium]|nr:hypothetical protein [Bacteroidales bacterium]